MLANVGEGMRREEMHISAKQVPADKPVWSEGEHRAIAAHLMDVYRIVYKFHKNEIIV
jgi:hypothetical protein